MNIHLKMTKPQEDYSFEKSINLDYQIQKQAPIRSISGTSSPCLS